MDCKRLPGAAHWRVAVGLGLSEHVALSVSGYVVKVSVRRRGRVGVVRATREAVHGGSTVFENRW